MEVWKYQGGITVCRSANRVRALIGKKDRLPATHLQGESALAKSIRIINRSTLRELGRSAVSRNHLW